ncbi:MAG: alpha/beta fold hydrolase [Candidatus Omnitrophica bacterium]|nr:alpha/beta fold hydrolase [Candidatus Omnitrophota bacterium]
MLFLHGWGVDGRIWRQQYKYFSEHYQTIVVDLPGHGKSSWAHVSLERMTQDIYALLDYLKILKTGIVGSSFGGLVGLKMFSLQPSRVSFLVSVGSQPKFINDSQYLFALDQERVNKLADQLSTNYPSMVQIFFRSLFTREERSSRRFRWIQAFRQNEDIPSREALLGVLDILKKEDLREVLSQISIPFQWINGAEDYICSKDLGGYLKEKIPHAQIHLFEKCGHFPFLTKPHEFNQVVEKFLEKL